VASATLKSGIVTGYSVSSTFVTMHDLEFSSPGPVIRLISASILAAAAWWLGLVMTKHRLLAQIGMATDGMAVGVPSLHLSGNRAGRKSPLNHASPTIAPAHGPEDHNAHACAKVTIDT
jgi:hypothetical protein